MKIHWTKRSGKDLEKIHSYISYDSILNAEKVVSLIYDTGDNLFLNFPEVGILKKGKNRTFPVLGTSYYFIYEIKKDTVYIKRIYHGARKYPKIID